MGEITPGEILCENLFYKKENGWLNVDSIQEDIINRYAIDYINFLNRTKTERECIKEAVILLERNGFKNINELSEIKPNDRIYYINRSKELFASVIGSAPLDEGMQLIGAHVDSPRLDLKPNPLYEEEGFAYFKTRYYGGIKKYQWTCLPLSLHGVLTKETGEMIEIKIGENKDEPVFTISDLLPHLSKNQNKKTLENGIEGEDLNILVGSVPYKNSNISSKVKLNILNILNKKYGITEKDFISSEIEAVPALEARSLGFDNSMVVGYGQDDRVCVYAALKAILNIENPYKTATLILADKEEIGSVGNTGMYSTVFEYYVAKLLEKTNQDSYNKVNEIFCNSKMLSADVTSAFDPNYSAVYEKNNESYLNKGVSINKYTGGNGKKGANDASAEFIWYIINILEKNNISYQLSDMGKVDIGGGGTIAYILANRGMDVIDLGVPILSMHSPYEITSKYDIYMAFRAYCEFYKS